MEKIKNDTNDSKRFLYQSLVIWKEAYLLYIHKN
jgi:hypothetical protein